MAMQALCCLDAQGEDAMDLAVAFIRESDEPLDATTLAQHMLTEAWAGRRQADEMLAQLSHHWDIRRMAMVDRNILRLAIWELRTRTAPSRVVVNEAIRLAKEFSTAESPRFINGILDAVARRLGQDIRQGPESEEPAEEIEPRPDEGERDEQA